jgi:hypothetical protein
MHPETRKTAQMAENVPAHSPAAIYHNLIYWLPQLLKCLLHVVQIFMVINSCRFLQTLCHPQLDN